jgi:hypothetical protein
MTNVALLSHSVSVNVEFYEIMKRTGAPIPDLAHPPMVFYGSVFGGGIRISAPSIDLIDRIALDAQPSLSHQPASLRVSADFDLEGKLFDSEMPKPNRVDSIRKLSRD